MGHFTSGNSLKELQLLVVTDLHAHMRSTRQYDVEPSKPLNISSPKHAPDDLLTASGSPSQQSFGTLTGRLVCSSTPSTPPIANIPPRMGYSSPTFAGPASLGARSFRTHTPQTGGSSTPTVVVGESPTSAHPHLEDVTDEEMARVLVRHLVLRRAPDSDDAGPTLSADAVGSRCVSASETSSAHNVSGLAPQREDSEPFPLPDNDDTNSPESSYPIPKIKSSSSPGSPHPHISASTSTQLSLQGAESVMPYQEPGVQSCGPPCVASSFLSEYFVNATIVTEKDLVPIKMFIHEVLRSSCATCSVFQSALCYIEAVRVKVLELAEKEKQGLGVRSEPELRDRIVRDDEEANASSYVNNLLDISALAASRRSSCLWNRTT
ncbi:hypothetical protein DFH11DRAFT_1722531 [Phellopilus nigrolimitatus]|nr:hypothetical protein DFH11DRAFT_1722531 [Phellopilus nigrolimitatus]